MTEITDEIDMVRQSLAMHDSGYKWSVHCEHVATLLREYDRLSTPPRTDAAGVREIEVVADAMRAKREELIAQPLQSIWAQLARAALEAAGRLSP